jgi:uncharacterized protein (DUF58 family)
MRNVAGFALTTSSAFLAVVAIMLNAPSLFYMGTALIATIGACHLQAWLSVKGLRFERIAPASARIGDLVTVEIVVWSYRKIRRPLITILDKLPARLHVSFVSPSLPIAPAYDLPIQTQYQFRAVRRGKYKWTGVVVQGTDALGLVTKQREYETPPTELTVLPRPIPVAVDLPAAAGWGISEAESGQTRGAGIEPRGVRGYVSGDSLRHVHWRSSAKTGQLLVKEFEAGTHAAAAFLFQRTRGTDIGSGASSSLDLMCGHAVFMAENFLRQGARVEFPGLDSGASHISPHERVNEIYEVLAGVQADREQTVGSEIAAMRGVLPAGSVLFVMLTVADETLPGAVVQMAGTGTQVITLLYDGAAFATAKKDVAAWKGSNKRPASDPMYIEQLRSAGAYPVVMPMEVSVDTANAA